jgi:CRP/FNR family transcriptional regulator, cyclic AMP receptor protein
MRRQFPDDQAPWMIDVFHGLDTSSQKQLRDAGATHVLEEGERVPDAGGFIVRIESGLVKLAVTSEGRSLTVGIFGPGDTICAPLFHEWDNDLYYIQAQEQTEVRLIPQEAVLKVAAARPEFGRNLLRQLSWATWQLMNTIRMLTFYNLPQRVSQVLLNLAQMFGRPDEKGGVRLGLRFTQEELAELAGARRETLSTVLQEFRENEVLDLRYARIDIKDPDALQELAGTEPLPFLNRGINNGK